MNKHIILLKSNLGARGGLEKYTLRLANAFKENHCKVTILTTTSPKNSLPQLEDIEVIPLFKNTKLSALNLYLFNQKCKKWIQNHSPGIIFGLDRNKTQTYYRAGNGVHAAYLKSRKKIESGLKTMTFSMNPLHQLILHYEKSAFENVDLKTLFTNSHMVKKDILNHYNTLSTKIHVVHNGVEWNEFKEPFFSWQELRPSLFTSLRLDPINFQLLFIGHGYKRKGLELLLHALATIKEEKFQLSIVGKDKQQLYFKTLINTLGLTNKVHIFGERSDIRSFYQACDALLIPSIYDPFANVTVEALAMGLSVLSSSFNGGHEVLTPDSGIIINDLFNKEALACNLKDLFLRRKTKESALKIRDSIKYLDFSHQLTTIVQEIIKK
ncbi:MAG: glycosyltransferase family 4 protein [Chlamydiales bacterium]|nr:glycosyltransferase family 4 protein [Chlamydiales bacterium]